MHVNDPGASFLRDAVESCENDQQVAPQLGRKVVVNAARRLVLTASVCVSGCFPLKITIDNHDNH